MNVASPPRSVGRRAELGPFDLRVTATKSRASSTAREARAQADLEFGCVDWFQYHIRDARKQIEAPKRAAAAVMQ
jgi:hypothetical protein